MTSRLPEMTLRFPEMLSRLSARDRAVYALDLPQYEAHSHAETKVAQTSASWPRFDRASVLACHED